MKPTKELPSAFVQYEKFGQNQYKRTVQFFYILAFIFAVLYYVLFNWLAQILRPGFMKPIEFDPTFKFTSIAVMIIITVITFLIHEWIHLLFLRFITGEWARIVFGFLGIHTEADSWYLPRNQFLVVNLAPLCLLSLVGLIAMLYVPDTAVDLVVFGLTTNAAGSVSDLLSSIFIALFPASAYFNTRGAIFIEKLYLKPQEEGDLPKWRWQFFVEGILSRMGN